MTDNNTKIFSLKKVHLFPFIVQSIRPFHPEENGGNEFYLVDKHKIYDTNCHQLVYTFNCKDYEPKPIANNGTTPSKYDSSYIYQHPTIVEFYIEGNQLQGNKWRICFKVSEFNGKYFEQKKSESFEIYYYRQISRIDNLLLLHGVSFTERNIDRQNPNQPDGKYHKLHEYNQDVTDICCIDLENLKMNKIFGNSILHLSLFDNINCHERVNFVNNHFSNCTCNLFIDRRFCFVLRNDNYVLYDVILNKEVKLFENFMTTQNGTNCNGQAGIQRSVKNLVEYRDGHVIYYDRESTHMYKLSDCDEEIAKDDECTICFNHTDRSQILVPCGHTKYCDICICKIKECSICHVNIKQIIRIY